MWFSGLHASATKFVRSVRLLCDLCEEIWALVILSGRIESNPFKTRLENARRWSARITHQQRHVYLPDKWNKTPSETAIRKVVRRMRHSGVTDNGILSKIIMTLLREHWNCIKRTYPQTMYLSSGEMVTLDPLMQPSSLKWWTQSLVSISQMYTWPSPRDNNLT